MFINMYSVLDILFFIRFRISGLIEFFVLLIGFIGFFGVRFLVVGFFDELIKCFVFSLCYCVIFINFKIFNKV